MMVPAKFLHWSAFTIFRTCCQLALRPAFLFLCVNQVSTRRSVGMESGCEVGTVYPSNMHFLSVQDG